MSSPRRIGLPDTVRMRHDTHFVDQLVRPGGESIGRLIPLEEIEPNPDQPRRSFAEDALGRHVSEVRGVASWLEQKPYYETALAGTTTHFSRLVHGLVNGSRWMRTHSGAPGTTS